MTRTAINPSLWSAVHRRVDRYVSLGLYVRMCPLDSPNLPRAKRIMGELDRDITALLGEIDEFYVSHASKEPADG